MRIIGLAGWSGSGKTTLLTKAASRASPRAASASRRSSTPITISTSTGRARIRSSIGRPARPKCWSCPRNRWALMHELRGAPEPAAAANCWRSCPTVDLVLIEGFKRESFPKLEIHRAANGKPLLHPEDPWIVAIASDTAAAAGERAGDRSQRHRRHRRPAARASGAGRARSGPRGRGLMAQLTDDCFAFSGPLLPVDELEKIIAERVTPGRGDRKRGARAKRAAASWRATSWRRSTCRISTIPRSTATPCATRPERARRDPPRRRRSCHRRRVGVAAARAGRGDPHLHRRADAAGRRHRVHAGRRAGRGWRRHRAGRD